MTQMPLFNAVSNKDNAAKFIGQRLYLEFKNDSETHINLYHHERIGKNCGPH